MEPQDEPQPRRKPKVQFADPRRPPPGYDLRSKSDRHDVLGDLNALLKDYEDEEKEAMRAEGEVQFPKASTGEPSPRSDATTITPPGYSRTTNVYRLMF